MSSIFGEQLYGNFIYGEYALQLAACYTVTDYGCGKLFSGSCTESENPIVSYTWTVSGESGVLATLSNQIDFYYNWPFTGNFQVELEVQDSANLTDTYSETYSVSTCPVEIKKEYIEVPVPGGSGGGMSGGIQYIEKEKPFPTITIKFSDEEDENYINIIMGWLKET